MTTLDTSPNELLTGAGVSADAVAAWTAAHPTFPHPAQTNAHDLPADAEAAARYFALGTDLLRRLPPKPQRTGQEQAATDHLLATMREARTRFLRAYVDPIYTSLTDDYRSFVRAADLVYAAAERYPGLTPTRQQIAEEQQLPQKDKDGLEVDQGLFLSAILAHPRAGRHLVHAMLRPTPEALDLLPRFRETGEVDLGQARVQRVSKAGHVILTNTRFLNAEDDTTNGPLETAIDLVILDPDCQAGVLRGGVVDHPKYAGRRVFNAGLNLTRLYYGQISFMFYLTRDLGFVNKLYRGLTGPELWPDEPEDTLEKPWIAAVEAFAIGGGCQLLLVFDRVLAEQGAYFNLPARKEGIIPGAANLRFTRSVGDRIARQGILFDRQFEADSPEGRLLCDEVVPRDQMDAALARAVASLTDSGVVSAAGNRKALRVAQEPIDQFRMYMATYAREQANCHLSPALIRNLEINWVERERGRLHSSGHV
jgi:thioesterase DpgC